MDPGNTQKQSQASDDTSKADDFDKEKNSADKEKQGANKQGAQNEEALKQQKETD